MRNGPKATLTAVLCALFALSAPVLAGCGDFAAGISAYEEGRFEDAHAAFVRAEEAADGEAGPELSFNRGLAALRAGNSRDAESAAKRVAAADDPEMAALGAFLRGNAAYVQCELAARQADTPMAEPFAFDVAINYGETARDAWIVAAASRADWPKARRNVERAIRMLDELRAKKDEAERRRRKRTEPSPKPNPIPEPPPESGGTTTEEEIAAKAMRVELNPDQVRRLLEKLEEKEREKIALRRSHRRTRMAEVETDW